MAKRSKAMVTITKDIIKSEIERVPEHRLEALYEVVKIYSRTESATSDETLFSKLKRVSIDGPADFSENLDSYLSGEKTIG
jgi:hypothetical protein